MQSPIFVTVSRYFSSSTAAIELPKLKKISKIPIKYRPKAIEQAQKELTDYLHFTKNLSLTYAEQISNNSLFSLSELMSKVKFTPSNFSGSLQRYLRYHPINEFEFFYESIGISYDEINGFLPVNKFFLDEDCRGFSVACALWEFGFPWNKLGNLYKEEVSIFDNDVSEVKERLLGLREYGFDSDMIIGVCLAFPCVLSRKNCGEMDVLYNVLKTVFVDYDLISCVEGNVDAWFDVCRKIRIFYDLGCGNRKMGELMGRSKYVFLDYSEETLVQKVEFFTKLNVCKEEIGVLLLSEVNILEFDLETPCFSVLGILKYFGLEEEKLRFIMENCPYVLGRNKLANLPNVMRSLDLNEWFFTKMRSGDHNLLGAYALNSPEEDLDKCYTDGLMKIGSSRLHAHTLSKLNFLHGIGFGENRMIIKALKDMHGSKTELQERFDFLLSCGIEFPNLCKMISRSPKILNQQIEYLDKKVKYLCEDMGYSLQILDVFPAYLNFNLEKRIKPRYRFHTWLRENHLLAKEYSLASLVANSEKIFIAQICRLHPAAPKKWLESFFEKDLDSN